MPARGRWRLHGRRRVVAVVAAVAVVVAGGTVAGLGATDRLPGQDAGSGAPAAATPVPTPSATPRPEAPPVLAPLTPGAQAPALPVARLQALLTSRDLGRDVSALVLDADTGQTLLDRRSTVAHTPASVAKLATTTAALVAVGPGTRLSTRVVAGAAPDEIVLVGGGDPSLTLRRDPRAAFPRRASLTALADATVAALRRRTPTGDPPSATPGSTAASPSGAPTSPSTSPTGTSAPSPVTLRVDDSLYSGPAVAPTWPPSYVGSGVVSPVSALMVDEGRVRAGANARERDPALAAGRDLARLLAARGVPVRGAVTRAPAPAGAATLAAVTSPTIAELVETDLQTSDNDLAEGLLRQVALARHQPPTFDGGTAAVVAVLDELGVPTDGVVLRDGSGLSRASAVPPQTLARLLSVAATGPANPALRSVVTGLPVAGFSGTLALRFDTLPTRRAAGVVRAKTGTLTGVSSLAGVTTDGVRTLVFVAMSDSVPSDGTLAAREVLDRFAATVGS